MICEGSKSFNIARATCRDTAHLRDVFQGCCDALKLHAMCCDRKFNMLNIFLLILEYLNFKRFGALWWEFNEPSCNM